MVRLTAEPLDHIARLPCWSGSIDPVPLVGGITNKNYLVSDRGEKFVVRLGEDIPIHGVMRFNELAASRAAFEAGISPEVIYAEPGALVLRYIEGRALTSELVRDDALLPAAVDLVKRCHERMPACCATGIDVLGIPGDSRIRGRTAHAGESARGAFAAARRTRGAPRTRGRTGEHRVRPQRPARRQFHRRRQTVVADRLGLRRFQQPVVRSGRPRFQQRTRCGSDAVRPRTLFRRGGCGPRTTLRRNEVRFAAARDDVEHGVGDSLEDSIRLRRLHPRQPRAVRRAFDELLG